MNDTPQMSADRRTARHMPFFVLVGRHLRQPFADYSTLAAREFIDRSELTRCRIFGEVLDHSDLTANELAN